MAEHTHVKNRTAQEKYLEELRDTEAYKLLSFAFLHGLTQNMPKFDAVVAKFLDTGIIETEPPFTRGFYLNGR